MFDLKTPVLVVDDMFAMRKMVSRVLKDMGFTTIVEAGDGNLAMEALNNSKEKFGFILSDWNMPNCTGIELLKRLRADKVLTQTPFVMITAESEAKQIQEALKLGIDNYIIKPFTPKSLADKIEETHAKVLKRAA